MGVEIASIAAEDILVPLPSRRKRRWQDVLDRKRLHKELVLVSRREHREWVKEEKRYWLAYSAPAVLVPETDTDDLVDDAIDAMERAGHLPAAFCMATTEYRAGREDAARELKEQRHAIYLRSDTEPLSYGETAEASDIDVA